MGASLEWSVRTRRQEETLPLRGAACVIEPDDDERGGVSSLLRHMGFVTHETGSGSVGGMIAEQVKLSVVVVNVMVDDGLKLIRKLRARAPSAVIVALTPDSCALTLAKVAGADFVLASPSCGEALCSVITERLGATPRRARLWPPLFMAEWHAPMRGH